MNRFLPALSATLLALAGTTLAGEITITLPTETSTYKTTQGVELVQANCTLCHSAEYVLVQPRMPRKFWEATLKKMREKFGAPIAEENVSGLLDYLTTNYGAP